MRLLKIGRDQSCNIVLPSPRVSSLHAEITILNSGDMLLEDKNSLNGTYVMNRRINPGATVSIKRGDAIRFADMELDWSRVPMITTQPYKAIYGIGKDVRNEIQLSGATVSRFHATVFVEKDGKCYIEDHSKNGTTVNGTKINSGQRVRIKRKDAISCGGVPVKLNIGGGGLDWRKILLPALVAAAAIFLVVLGIKYFPSGIFDRTKSDAWLYDRYKNATCLVVGQYHYKVSIPNVDLNKLNQAFESRNLETIPTRIIKTSNGFRGSDEDFNTYFGTGFFADDKGKIVTNLHIVKPWLADMNSEGNLDTEGLKQSIGAILSSNQNILLRNGYNLPLTAYISSIKVEGVLDYIGVVPNGKYYEYENSEKCRVQYDEGENLDVDVAMIATVNGRLPQGCSYVNIKDSIRSLEDDYKVGTHIYTIGFPAGLTTQDAKNQPISALGHSGSITQATNNYSFGFDAASFSGASGSPIFDKQGHLVGVVNRGIRTTNFNQGIKGRYIKEMSEKVN